MRLRAARTHPLTIVELMVSIAIIMMVSAALAWGIGSALQTQRFYDDVRRVRDRLQLAQDLMLITESDVEIRFFRDVDITQMELKIIGEVTPFLERSFEGTVALQSIQGLWYRAGARTYESQDAIVLRFFACGPAPASRSLELATIRDPDGGERRFISIPRQPGTIRVSGSREELINNDNDRAIESQEIFPYEMFSDT